MRYHLTAVCIQDVYNQKFKRWRMLVGMWRKENPVHCRWGCKLVATRLPWWFSWQRIRLQRRRYIFDPWIGKIPGEGNDNLLQYSCLGNPMDRGAWRAAVHGGHKESDTTWQLNHHNYHSYCGKQYAVFLKKLKIELPCDPVIPLLGIYQKDTKAVFQRGSVLPCSLQDYQ